MIMQGLDKGKVTSSLFTQPGVQTDTWVLHVPARLFARFENDAFKPKGSLYNIEFGISGCPRHTIQVVFFTDDETFIDDEDKLEQDLCSVVRTTPVHGEIWLGYSWPTHGDFRLFACGITAGGETFSVSNSLCDALEQYYVASRGLSGVASLPAHVQNSIAALRLEAGAAIGQGRIANLMRKQILKRT